MGLGPVTQSLTLPVAGLVTDPGPFTAAPEGSLVEAQNVVVLRPGVIEPRPGTMSAIDATLKAGGYSTQYYYTNPTAGDFTWAVTGGGSWIVRWAQSSTITGPSSFAKGYIRACPTGGRGLVTTTEGVCTLPLHVASPAQGSATVAYRSGLPQPSVPVWSLNVGGAIPAGVRIRYRFTIRRILENGVLVESPPSNPIDVLTTGANTTIYFSGPATTDGYFAYRTDSWTTNGFGEPIQGDQLCVWRSASVTPFATSPSDELRLRAVIPYDNSNQCFCDPQRSTPGIPVPWGDRLADTQWNGPPLYTNATQEGAAAANYRPEYARDIELYNDMTFYAGAKTPQRLDLHLNALGGANDPQTCLKNYLFAGTGTTAIGSPTITAIGAADMAQLVVGQVLQNNGTLPTAAAAFPAQTQITALTATTATMSANALTAGPVAFRVWDWVDIIAGGQTQRMYVGTTGIAMPQSLALGVVSFRDLWAADGGAQGAESQYNCFPSNAGIGNGGARFRRVALYVTSGTLDTSTLVTTDMTWSFVGTGTTALAAFTVRSTKPLAWDQYVDSVTGVTSQQQGSGAELRWSKSGEPEHVPLANRRTIGDVSYPIRRIVAARNSLLVFKDDGLYQVYGNTPDDLTTELIDRTILIPRPLDETGSDEQSKWLDRFDDRVFAMTTRGPMVIGDTGGQPIGAPKSIAKRRRRDSRIGAGDSSTRAIMIDPTTRRVGFFCATAADPLQSESWLIDVDANTWTYWILPRVVGGAATTGVSPYGTIGLAGGYVTMYTRADRSMLDDSSVTLATLPPTYDGWTAATCTINTVTGTGPYTVTIAAGSEWTPEVGDVLIRSSVMYDVLSVLSPTQFTTEAQPTTGVATWYEAYESRVVWAGNAEGNTGAEKHYSSMALPMDLTTRIGALKSYFAGYRNPTSVEAYAYLSQSNGVSPYALVPQYTRVAVPSDIARDWAIKSGFSLKQAGAWFSTSGMSLLFNPISPDKVKR